MTAIIMQVIYGYNYAGYITVGCERGGVDDDYAVGDLERARSAGEGRV